MADDRAARNPYETGLERNQANHVALTPLGFLSRAAHVYPERTAWRHGARSASYREFYARARRLASALTSRGIGPGDTVSIMAPNIPAMLEAHYGVPMTGAVLNALNFRLDAPTIAFILDHAEAKILFTDRAFSAVVSDALKLSQSEPLVIDIDDAPEEGGDFLGPIEYEAFLRAGDPEYDWRWPTDEWDHTVVAWRRGELVYTAVSKLPEKELVCLMTGSAHESD